MASLNNEAASSSSSSQLSSLDDQIHYRYEVFLSFHGKDTRFNFTDHLYTALCERGIETFRDDFKLKKGEDISPALVKAIEESRASIVIFSENYASSRWCLDELIKIMECRQSNGQEVRAVFYKVVPSDVRHQIGAFGDAFAKLDQGRYKDKIGKWRKALEEAAELSGWTYKEDRYESQFIKDVIGELSRQVVNTSCVLQVAAHPIGIESCRQDVNKLLCVEENSVHMVGIWGPGGIGKTTIAKDVFNSIRHKFEGSCFLADVRSKSSSTSEGLAQLQETLLFDILSDSNLKVHSVAQGVSFIKTRMRHKKVLLILDDVSHSSQLQNLVPSLDCFGLGSRVIITTRDKHWLNLMVDVYEVKMLDDRQALELFSLNAFKRNEPPGDYLELAQQAIHYAQGLPLALTVLGSHLCYCNSKDEWKATLDSCKEGDPQIEIRNILKISYDALGVDLQGYLLDIACFFKGGYVDEVKPILEACYDPKSATVGIAQLQQKALIRIERKFERDQIWMHDLIEDMGKHIVYQESPDEAGKRSRLWCKDDIDHVLTNNTGTDKVIGIQFMLPYMSMIDLNAESFSTMTKLRYISMGYETEHEIFYDEIDHLSKELRWLSWTHCPLQSFPSGFHANKLVKLKISDSFGITRLWDGCKNFSRLTCMDLRGCESLTELPDFSGIPNLKELDLSYCTSLVEVPNSVGLLAKLVTLKVDCCSNLIKFPRKINLKSVETISISDCKLEEFSEFGDEMVSLRSLNLSGSCIIELHPSITNLIGLEELILDECQNLMFLPHNIYELHNLRSLDASNCPKLVTFPEIPMQMDSLRELRLSGSGITELDESIGNLIGLEELDLADCKNLVMLPCCALSLLKLKYLNTQGCSCLSDIDLVAFQLQLCQILELC